VSPFPSATSDGVDCLMTADKTFRAPAKNGLQIAGHA